MSGKKGASGRRRTERQLLRIAIAAALGDVFPRAGQFARARLAGAVLDSPIVDSELQIIALALHERRRTPWAKNWRHGDGDRATVNGMANAPVSLRRAVACLFDMRTSVAAEVALRKFGLSEIEIGRLQILAHDHRTGGRAFSYDIAGMGFERFWVPVIRSALVHMKFGGLPFFSIPPALLETSQKLAAISHTMPDLTGLAACTGLSTLARSPLAALGDRLSPFTALAAQLSPVVRDRSDGAPVAPTPGEAGDG